MEALYTREQLVSFGNYLLSDKRKNLIIDNEQTEKELKEYILKCVNDADLQNWIDETR